MYTIHGTKWPFMCSCAIKRLLTHSLTIVMLTVIVVALDVPVVMVNTVSFVRLYLYRLLRLRNRQYRRHLYPLRHGSQRPVLGKCRHISHRQQLSHRWRHGILVEWATMPRLQYTRNRMIGTMTGTTTTTTIPAPLTLLRWLSQFVYSLR